MRGLGVTTYLFNEVATWAHALDLPRTRDEGRPPSITALRVTDLVQGATPEGVSIVPLEEGLASITAAVLWDQQVQSDARHEALRAAWRRKQRALMWVAVSGLAAALVMLMAVTVLRV